MEFQRERVFTSLNADELSAGDKVIVADCMALLREFVRNGEDIVVIREICGEENEERFFIEDETMYALAYLVERAENCTNCGNQYKYKVCDYPHHNGKCDRCDFYEPKTEPKAEHDCQSCKYKNCGFKDLNTKNICDRWEAEQKSEMPDLISLGNGQYAEKKHYRPFKDTDELIKVWLEKGSKWQHREVTMPLIWVRRKESNCKGQLITKFSDPLWVIMSTEAYNMTDLFKYFTFLDGSPCGVEE